MNVGELVREEGFSPGFFRDLEKASRAFPGLFWMTKETFIRISSRNLR
jgi:hypothetical protein